MKETDNVLEQKQNDTTLSNSKDPKPSSALRKVSNGIIVFAMILAFFAIVYFCMFIAKTRHEERFYYSIICLFGSISLGFSGLIGQCLDDIRNNTKKK